MAVLGGVSFDATPLSGVAVEFAKTARHFHERGYEVHLDLGYDIKADKERFFVPYQDEDRLLPPWVRLWRLPALDTVDGYDASLATAVLQEVVEKGDLRLMPEVERIADALCERVLRCGNRSVSPGYCRCHPGTGGERHPAGEHHGHPCPATGDRRLRRPAPPRPLRAVA